MWVRRYNTEAFFAENVYLYKVRKCTGSTNGNSFPFGPTSYEFPAKNRNLVGSEFKVPLNSGVGGIFDESRWLLPEYRGRSSLSSLNGRIHLMNIIHMPVNSALKLLHLDI